MARTWILHTETKGTGATMVPLDRERKRSAASPAEPVFRRREAPARKPAAPETRQPRRFRVVDVMTRQHLAEDATAREARDALRGVRSILDVSVYVYDDRRERWRLLTIAEQRAMLDLARA